MKDEFDEAFDEQATRPVGETGLPHDVQVELSDFVARLEERYDFNHGEVAAFYHMAIVLSEHLGKGKE